MINHSGEKYGRLTLIKRVENDNSGRARYLCKCDCGNEKIVKYALISSKKTQSCGCLHKDVCTAINKERINKSFTKNKYDLNKNSYGIGYLDDNTEFYFDKEDYEKIKDIKWKLDKDGYLIKSTYKTKLIMHRIVMDAQKDEIVDHISGNKLDNRKENLRIVTAQQNSMNRGLGVRNKSGKVGVSFNKARNKWVASIKSNGKSIYLGYYTELEDAIRARKEAEIKYFGEYRRK